MDEFVQMMKIAAKEGALAIRIYGIDHSCNGYEGLGPMALSLAGEKDALDRWIETIEKKEAEAEWAKLSW